MKHQYCIVAQAPAMRELACRLLYAHLPGMNRALLCRLRVVVARVPWDQPLLPSCQSRRGPKLRVMMKERHTAALSPTALPGRGQKQKQARQGQRL